MNNDNNNQGSNLQGMVTPVNTNQVGNTVTQSVQPQPVAQPQPVQTQPAQPQVVVQAQPAQPVQQAAPVTQPVQPQVVVQPNTVTPQPTAQINQPVAQTVIPQQQVVVAQPTVQNQVSTTTQPSLGSVTPLDDDVNNSKINFVSEGTKLKKKMNSTLKGIITSAIVAAIVLFGYFVVYPFVVKTFFHNPKKIFDTSIDTVTKSINSLVSDWYGSQSTISASFKIDSNYESLKDFSGYTYGIKFGYDSNNKDMEIGYNVANSNKQEYSVYNYIKNKSMYSRYSNYRDLIYVGNIDSDIEPIYSLFRDNSNSINEVSAMDINYIINKISSNIKNSFIESKFVKKDATIKINNTSLKAIKSTYVMNKNDIVNLKDTIVNDLSNDDKVIDILSKATGQEKEDVKKSFEDTSLDIEDDYSITISIYTYGNNVSFAGIEISDTDDKLIKYYTYDNELDVEINNVLEQNVTIKKIKNDKKYNASIKYGDKEVLTMVISTWEDNKKVFDYILEYDEQKLIGSIDYEFKQNSGINIVNISTKAKIGEYYANIVFDFTFDKKSTVANVNVGASKSLAPYEMVSVKSQFNELINDTPIKLLFQTSSGIYDPSMNNSVFKLMYQWMTNSEEDNQYHAIDVPDDYEDDDLDTYDYESNEDVDSELLNNEE